MGSVNVAIIFIGGNDIILKGNFGSFIADNVAEAIDYIYSGAGNPEAFLIMGVPEVGLAPAFRGNFSSWWFQYPVRETNKSLRTLARNLGVAFYDTANHSKEFLSDDSVTIGGVKFTNTQSSNNVYIGTQHTFFDALHLTAVGNAIIANAVIATLNETYGTDISLLSDLEILEVAGLAHLYSGETFMSDFDVTPYVQAP